jgi:arylsulfatase
LDTDVAGWDYGDGGALIRGGYKIINTVAPGQPRDNADWRLYNLVDDPGEHADLSADHPEMVSGMVAEWEANWK